MTPAAEAVLLAVLLALCLIGGVWLRALRPFLHQRPRPVPERDGSTLLLWMLLVSDALLLVLLLRALWFVR
jgi:hypothetical protein